ncbi:hypothetical protein CLOP_g11357 [Closterium sp. NIES-67]|nr:hypothetical protein CLOP_g11357 [Closterium sp. NIES-67]
MQAQYWREISSGNGASTDNPTVESVALQHTNGHDFTAKITSIQDPKQIAENAMIGPETKLETRTKKAVNVFIEPRIAEMAVNGASSDGNGQSNHSHHADCVDCVDCVDQGGGEQEPAVMSVASMMLDAQADLLDSLERPEILAIMDSITAAPPLSLPVPPLVPLPPTEGQNGTTTPVPISAPAPPVEGPQGALPVGTLASGVVATGAVPMGAVPRAKVVVELGAGIGRFTADLARRATWLTALDFLPHALSVNEQAHAHKHPNVDFVCADVADATTAALLTRLAPDLVFSNWLLMYLSDSEVLELARVILLALPPGGLLFFRESCLEQSGSQQRRTNPTHYRHPLFYCQAFSEAHHQMQGRLNHHHQQQQQQQKQNGQNHRHLPNQQQQDPQGGGKGWRFRLREMRSVAAYSRVKGCQTQVCWVWQKVRHAMGGTGSTTDSQDRQDSGESQGCQENQERQQYSLESILRYEHIYGHGFVSTGGRDSTLSVLPLLSLSPHRRVLDVGCGLGGSAMLMATLCGASVHAIDLSPTMISLAIERSRSIHAAAATSAPAATSSSTSAVMPVVQFEVADCLTRNFPDAAFDCIYTRDTLLHIQDKPHLFARFHRWLKPGGKVLITDYCSGKDKDDQWSDEFKGYVAQRGYHLVTVRRYSELLQAAGFHVLKAEDRSQQFLAILEEEKSRVLSEMIPSTSQVSNSDDQLVAGWTAKMKRVRDGDQAWGLFLAEKRVKGHDP